MDPLPLLVRYGTAVWMAALVALVAAFVMGDRLRRHRSDRRDAEARRRGLGEPEGDALDGAEGSVVVLEGRLVAGGAPAERFEDGGEAAVASAGTQRGEALTGVRAGRLSLATARGAVRLDGPVDVVVGAVETRTGRPPDRLDPPVRRRFEQAGGVWLLGEPVVLRSIPSGARVRVRGELGRAAGALDYREDAGGLCLLPPAGEVGGSLRLAVLDPPRPGERRIRATVRAASAGMLVFAGVFLAAPEIRGRGPIQGEGLAAVLAAIPLHRARALSAYAELLDAGLEDAPLDGERLDRAAAAAVLVGRCDRAVEILLDHRQWARAEAQATACGLPLLAARAAYERGDFDRAASLWDSGSTGVRDGAELLFALRVHLLAGDLPGATAAAHRAADALRGTNLPDYACIAETLDAQAHAGAGQIAAPPGCFRELVYDGSDVRSGANMWTVYLLNIEAGLGGWIADGAIPLDPFLGPPPAAPQWALVEGALAKLRATPDPDERDLLVRARLAWTMAGLEAASGRFEEALALVHEARSSQEVVKEHGKRAFDWEEEQRLATLEGVILMRAGRDGEAREALERGGRGGSLAAGLAAIVNGDRQGGAMKVIDSLPDIPSEDRRSRFFYAIVYDQGADLAARLGARRPPPPAMVRVAGLAVRNIAGWEALAAWLHRGEALPCHGCDVGARFADVGTRLALAEAIGDLAAAAELRATAAAFRRALLRRPTAVPLLLLEQIRRKSIPAVEIALGDRHSCERSADGTVRCWGAGDRGQLGAAGGGHRLPRVVDGLGDVAQIAAGGDATCARARDGSVLCWGDGSPVPTPVPGLSGAARIAVGHGRACAVGVDGTLTCWATGRGPRASPEPASLRGVTDVALGVDHACALRTDGTVWCWGSNAYGQLGDDTAARRDAPRPVPGIEGAIHLAAGYFHTCAVSGTSYETAFTCWGDGDKGQLGDGVYGRGGRRGSAVSLFRGTGLSAGNAFTCWVGDAVACWGTNGLGQLGDGSLTDRAWPSFNHFVGVAQVAAGGAHACLLTKTGEVWCWGANRDGQVGDGSTATHEAPEMIRL